MEIKFNDLTKQWNQIKSKTMSKLEDLFQKSNFIGGNPIKDFEIRFADYIGTEYAIGVSNGTDALKISLASMNLESPCGFIIPANTFIATALAVTYLTDLNYELVLIDCDEYYQMDVNLLEGCLKKRRKEWDSCVIIPVHLYGHPANINAIMELAEDFNCFVLEDASQAHGASVPEGKVGKFGDISAFSLYPGKNLGAAGDAGIITTNNEELYLKSKSLRNYGSSKKYYYDYRGWNNRMDTIQAIILSEKLKFLDEWNEKRIKVARKYNELMERINDVVLPRSADYVDKNVYHIYALRTSKRDSLQQSLNSKGIPTVIHYPISIQKTKPFFYLDNDDNKNSIQFSSELLSLPMHPFLTDEEIGYVSTEIINFFSL